jgi:hypothetical protein
MVHTLLTYMLDKTVNAYLPESDLSQKKVL